MIVFFGGDEVVASMNGQICAGCSRRRLFTRPTTLRTGVQFLSNANYPSLDRPGLVTTSLNAGNGPNIGAPTFRRRSAATAQNHRAVTRVWAKVSPFSALSKPKLTTLVVLSAMSSFALSPQAIDISSLMYLGCGTFLASAAANALNQRAEPDFDASMARTATRPIVRGLVSQQEALWFAIATSVSGISILSLCNSTVAALGAANIALYAFAYTPLKRRHIANTWIGSIVGAIPPLMGWSASGASLLDPAAWALSAMLYAWQFPHFNALAWVVRDDYRRAAYKMMAVSHPNLNARVSLRYAMALPMLCVGLVATGAVHWSFLVTSAPFNALIVKESWRFFQHKANKEARKLFWVSVIWLPAVLTLAMIHKTGLWDGLLANIRAVHEGSKSTTPKHYLQDQ